MNKTLKHILYIFSAVVFAKLLGVSTIFLTAKILEPAEYGVLATLILFISYTPIMCLGTVESLVKKYPYYIGKGEPEKARAVEKSVQSSIVVSALVVLFLGFIGSYWLTPDFYKIYPPSIVRMTLVTSALCFFTGFYYNRLMAHQEFKSVSLVDTTRAILRLVLMISFGLFWGLEGVILGLLLHELLVCLFSAIVSFRVCGRVGLDFSPVLMAKMVRIGFPITIVVWIFILQGSIDRIVSMNMLGAVQTGHYSLGSSIISMLVLIPQVVTRVLYPKINEGVGRMLTTKELATFVVLPARGLSLLLPLLTGILILLVSPLYSIIFPKYLSGLQSAQILLLGAFFTCLISSGTNYLIAQNKLNILLLYSVPCFILNIAGNILLVRLGFGIEGIAVSAALSGALLTLLVWLEVFKNMGATGLVRIFQVVSLISPFFLGFTLLAAIFLVSKQGQLLNPVSSAIAAASFTVIYFASVFFVPAFKNRVMELYAANRKK